MTGGKNSILFLCTGNSARSQLAEALANTYASDSLRASSAGTQPQGVNPLAIEVMKEIGVDISDYRSKSVMELIDEPFDFVITLCDDAAGACPVFPGNAKVIHHGFEDPALAQGTHDEQLSAFKRARDSIKEYIMTLPGLLNGDKFGENE
jgi:arsenate reductase